MPISDNIKSDAKKAGIIAAAIASVYGILRIIPKPSGNGGNGDNGDIYGCTDPNAINYDPEVTIDDGSCTYPPGNVYGCTDPDALNYNPQANVDDGSCQYEPIYGEAHFDFSPTDPETGEEVVFDASGSIGDILEYRWIIIGMPDKTGKVITHAFGSSAIHSVKLIITLTDGTEYSTSRSITVRTPSGLNANVNVNFSGPNGCIANFYTMHAQARINGGNWIDFIARDGLDISFTGNAQVELKTFWTIAYSYYRGVIFPLLVTITDPNNNITESYVQYFHIEAGDNIPCNDTIMFVIDIAGDWKVRLSQARQDDESACDVWF